MGNIALSERIYGYCCYNRVAGSREVVWRNLYEYIFKIG